MKKLFQTLALFVALAPATVLAQLTSDAKMVWHLNEASGTTADDATANNRDGTASNGVAWSTGGKFGNSHIISAGGSISQTAYLPSPPFSVSLSVKTASFASSQVVWWMGDDGASTWNAHYIAIGTSGEVAVSSVASNNFFSATSGNTASVDTWMHIVCVWTSTTSRTVYLNGGTPVTNTDSSSPTGIDKIWVGKHGVSGGGSFFSGEVDEIVVFDKALNATEVATLWNGGAGDEYPYPAGGTVRIRVGGPILGVDFDPLGYSASADPRHLLRRAKSLRIRDARAWAHSYAVAP